MDFRVFSRNISENMHARCVREDTKQALTGNLQADGVQSRQTLFVRYCLCNLPKNLTMHLTHKLCTVLPYQLYHNRTGIATDFLVKIT